MYIGKIIKGRFPEDRNRQILKSKTGIIANAVDLTTNKTITDNEDLTPNTKNRRASMYV